MALVTSLKPDPVHIAASRFGLGARPGDLSSLADNPRGFVIRQLSKPKLALLADPDLAPTDVLFRQQRKFDETIRRAREASIPASNNDAAAAN